ncbi:MAG: 2-oxo acid dehydrogenase subunit E2 [Acidothermus sp.]|nr:2-oxo acid dehydrogenase subunit E2 [Acidothermus sp.]MCL6537671.1 2-oxo acid dehydrogenase subunit E2 [Acidothermus sp.]
MPVVVTMPSLGESVTEGTVTRWLKQVGERVNADEPLLEVSTDKVDTEIPAPASGILREIKVREDETVGVGAELAVIDEDGGTGTPPAPPAAESAAPPAESAAPPAESAAPAAESAAPVAESAAPSAPSAPPPAESAAVSSPFRPGPAPVVETPPAWTPTPAAQTPAQPPAPAVQTPPTPAPAPAAPPTTPAPSTVGEDLTGTEYVTPLVRKLAAEHGVDLASITGTGVGGRIRKQDVLAAAMAKQASAAQGPVAAPERGRTEPLSRLRAVIAARAVESLQTSAQLTAVAEVDVTRIVRLCDATRSDFQAREGVALTFLPFLALAAVEALKQYPVMNASIDPDAGTVTYHDTENLGFAVDTDRGLLFPVVHDAGRLNLAGLARAIVDLGERARSGKVTPAELSGGTFSVMDVGGGEVLFETPILVPPQVGILSAGAIVKRPVVVEDPELGETIAIRSVVHLALTYDHRLVDSADAARFLGAVKSRLEEGRFESELGA